MKVAVMFGEGKAGLADREDPVPDRDFVLVKVLAVPMCTEYKMFKSGHKGDWLGHEAAGEVAATAQPGKVKVGDRVVVMPQYPCGKCALCLSGDYIYCQACVDLHKITGNPPPSGSTTYAQYVIKQDWLLVPVPDDISIEHAGMACCGLGPTFGAMERMTVDSFDTILITGMGPVGLGGVINGTHRGARVIAVEGQPYRAALAKKLGAAEVIDPADPDALKRIMGLTGGRGVDAAVDCSGAPQAQRLMIDAVRRRGRAAFVGESWDPLAIKVSDDMIRKGLVLHGSWHYNLALTPKLMEIIRREKSRLDLLITHRFPMSKVQEAWELQITGNCGKVVLDPWV
jgi:L-iditol 2-dehydrogenase